MSLRGPNNKTRLNRVPDPTGTSSSIQQTDGGFGNVTPKTSKMTGFMLLRSCAAAAGNFFSKHEELVNIMLGIAITALFCTIGGIITLSWEILLVSLPVLIVTGGIFVLPILDGILSCFNPSYSSY